MLRPLLARLQLRLVQTNIAATMPAAGGRSPAGESNRAGRCQTAGDDQKGVTTIHTLGGAQRCSLNGCGRDDLNAEQIGEQITQ